MGEGIDDSQVEDIDDLPFTSFDELRGEAPKEGRARFDAAMENIFRWRPDLIYLRGQIEFPKFLDNEKRLLIKIKGDRVPSETHLSPTSPQGDFEKVISAFLSLRSVTDEAKRDPTAIDWKFRRMKQVVESQTRVMSGVHPDNVQACQEYGTQMTRSLEILERILKDQKPREE